MHYAEAIVEESDSVRVRHSFCSALAIVCFYLMKSLMKSESVPVTFKSLVNKNNNIVVEINKSESLTFKELAEEYVSIFIEMFRSDTGEEPNVIKFDSREALNAWFYTNSKQMTGPDFVSIGIGFRDFYDLNAILNEHNHTNEFIVYWNSTEEKANLVVDTFVTRLQWKKLFGRDKDFAFHNVRLLQRLMNTIFGYLAPMLVSDGIIAIIPLFIIQPIIDISGEVRQYMISCTLSLVCYWAAAFVIDFAIWICTVTLIWITFLAAQIVPFIDNAFNIWYGFVMAGPSFLLMIYCVTFLFNDPASAARQTFFITTIVLLIPIIIGIVTDDTPIAVNWIYGLLPALHIQRLLNRMLVRTGIWTENLSFYWKDPTTQSYLILELIDIVIYGGILIVIEYVRIRVTRAGARRSFGDYNDFFKNEKAKHPVTDEARAMEDEVANTNNNYTVRIVNCSRLFFNTAGNPIPAVNCVSLGVREGSLFGFLGANGAGKTTLIKMITSMLPPSDGTIEILGRDIAQYNDPTLLSICPQFNTHPCDELTPDEHFVMYSMLFQLTPEEAASETNRLISILELEELKDKPIRELSGGDVRKLAIALSFLGPAKIILLDEPTASLDAVARHHVHEMISSFKGEKTFMLCTHLLSEAESLCDNISIMIKGCVYTVGSPSYLSGKFGTDFKVDVMLTDESEDSAKMCNKFFEEHIPTAILSITRPKARIYNVPAADISLPELFTTMETGKQANCGFNYYTCSSSSLERVFMEIVHLSECDDGLGVGD
jgi:ABC-type multidrug transport system ATPase subunit